MFPGGLEGKVSACNARDPGSIRGSGRFPWRRKWQPTPVFLPGESHEWRSMVGYSPRGLKESDTTEQLHFLSFSCCGVWALGCTGFSSCSSWVPGHPLNSCGAGV